jgi:hypothetical protein
MSHMIVQCGGISRSSNKDNHNNHINSNNHRSHNNKDDIINVTKAVARKSILMQITARAKAANGFL